MIIPLLMKKRKGLDNMKNKNYLNSSGYYDPTSGEALDHIIHEERVKERKQRKEKKRVNNKPNVQNPNANKRRRNRRAT